MDLNATKRNEEIEKLVSKAQKGDSDAFGRLYDIFVDSIYRYVYFRVGSTEAEDLTELVFLKTWENIRQYKSNQHSFSSWIFRIAHNAIVDYYRSFRQNGELDEDIVDPRREFDARTCAHDSFDKQLLQKAMSELKDHYRQIIILKYINGLSNEEISLITGRSHSALRILQFRALKNLRRILEKRGITDF